LTEHRKEDSQEAPRLESVVWEFLRQRGLHRPRSTLLAAVSGGPDSVALLRLLASLREKHAFRLLAAHFNHGLRAGESDQDERFVVLLCEGLGVPLHVKRLDEKPDANLAAELRRHRYDFLTDCAAEEGAAILTGHTLNDQVETFLMKLFRGAGPSGLSGIHAERRTRAFGPPVRVLRPLLSVPRSEILAYLDRIGQNFRTDPSNLNLERDRNWVRAQLIPQLQKRLNPGAMDALARTAGLMGDIENFLEEEAERRLPTRPGPKTSLPIAILQEAPRAVKLQMVRRAIRSVKGDLFEITLAHILRSLELAVGASGRRIHLPSEIRVMREFENLTFFRAELARIPAFAYRWDGGDLRIPEVGKSIRARIAEIPAESDRRNFLKALPERAKIRNRRPGDRFQPGAGRPAKSLKKLLIEARIPRLERDRLLILESEGVIRWVEDFPPHPSIQCGPEEAEGFLLEVETETFS
jgi:tRNA(Ile)-lysidine synthase